MARRGRRICEDLAGEGRRRQTKEAQLTDRRLWTLVVSSHVYTEIFGRLASLMKTYNAATALTSIKNSSRTRRSTMSSVLVG